MKNKKAIKKIEKAGLNIEFCLNGFIVASGLINGEYKKYKADTIQGLINLIF